MNSRDVANRIREVLSSRFGVAGTVLALFVGLYRLVEVAGSMEFIQSHWPTIEAVLLRYWGLVGLIVGFGLIAKAIYDTSHHPRLQQEEKNTDGSVSASLVPAAADTRQNDSAIKDGWKKRLYVGEMGIDVSKLSDEGVVEIWVRCFNATNHSLWARRLRGSVVVRQERNGSLDSEQKLPPAAILQDRAPTENLADCLEFLVVLEQRIPKELAARILEIGSENGIQFGFDDFDIVVDIHGGSPSDGARLPLWNAIRLTKDGRSYRNSRVVVARMAAISR